MTSQPPLLPKRPGFFDFVLIISALITIAAWICFALIDLPVSNQTEQILDAIALTFGLFLLWQVLRLIRLFWIIYKIRRWHRNRPEDSRLL